MSKTSTTQGSGKLMSQIRQHPLMALRDEMDDLLSRFFGGGEEGWLSGAGAPLVDLVETDTAVEVSLDLPGIDPEQLDIHLAGATLTIGGERKAEAEERGKTFHRLERRRGKFVRTVTVPCPVIEEEAVAEYKDGILTITLPKSQEARTRKIRVKH